MKYYMVVCERGHCGRKRYTEIKFAEQAPNLLKAMKQAKAHPAVKHTRPVLRAWEISKEEYYNYRKESAYDRV